MQDDEEQEVQSDKAQEIVVQWPAETGDGSRTVYINNALLFSVLHTHPDERMRVRGRFLGHSTIRSDRIASDLQGPGASDGWAGFMTPNLTAKVKLL